MRVNWTNHLKSSVRIYLMVRTVLCQSLEHTRRLTSQSSNLRHWMSMGSSSVILPMPGTQLRPWLKCDTFQIKTDFTYADVDVQSVK